MSSMHPHSGRRRRVLPDRRKIRRLHLEPLEQRILLDCALWDLAIEIEARDEDSRTATASNNGFAFVLDDTPPRIHRIFVSSIETLIDETMTFPPRLPSWGGIDNGDWTCTYLAYRAGLAPGWDGVSPVYQALLSIEGLAARDRIDIEGEVVNMAGETIAWGAADFWSGTHLNSVTYNEKGVAVPMGDYVWTGTQANGQWAGASCGQWNYLSDFWHGRGG